MLTYLLWLAIFVWLPLLILWAANRSLIRRYLSTLVACVICALVFAVPWDSWATYKGMWSFPSAGVVGIYIINLPIEEYLFISFVTLLAATLTLVLRERMLRPERAKRRNS